MLPFVPRPGYRHLGYSKEVHCARGWKVRAAVKLVLQLGHLTRVNRVETIHLRDVIQEVEIAIERNSAGADICGWAVQLEVVDCVCRFRRHQRAALSCLRCWIQLRALAIVDRAWGDWILPGCVRQRIRDNQCIYQRKRQAAFCGYH
jgi:hypothetical protein